MADLEQWLPAVPEGRQLLAAAPMVAEWRGPVLSGWKAFVPGAVSGLTYPLMMALGRGDMLAVWWVPPVYLLVLLAASRIYWVWWRKGHPRPTGMAAAVDWKRGRGPVLLVTGSEVLQTGLRNASAGRARPLGAAKEIPGLVAVDAVEERLVLRFEDGSEAWLRQRFPTPGAAARVAELAEPVLRRRQPDDHPAAATP